MKVRFLNRNYAKHLSVISVIGRRSNFKVMLLLNKIHARTRLNCGGKILSSLVALNVHLERVGSVPDGKYPPTSSCPSVNSHILPAITIPAVIQFSDGVVFSQHQF
jgi:hypothetical protein